MTTIQTTTYANLTTLQETASAGDTYYETDNNRIVTWNGTNWTYYNNDGSVAPYSNTYSMQFDGANEYLSIGNPTEVNFDSDMSMSFWIKYTNISSGYITAIAKMSGGTDPQWRVYLGNQTGGTKDVRLQTWNGTARTQTNSSGLISHNQWHHIAVTIEDGVTNGTKLYIDGTTAFTSTHSMVSSSYNFQIAGVGSNYFNGLIDEVALFDSALSSTDVAALRDTGGANPVPADISSLSPTGWWRMGDGAASWDGTNWTIPDQTANGNDATSVNMEEADRVSGSGNIPG